MLLFFYHPERSHGMDRLFRLSGREFSATYAPATRACTNLPIAINGKYSRYMW
jgi:hypothetical protein